MERVDSLWPRFYSGVADAPTIQDCADDTTKYRIFPTMKPGWFPLVLQRKYMLDP